MLKLLLQFYARAWNFFEILYPEVHRFVKFFFKEFFTESSCALSRSARPKASPNESVITLKGQ